MEGIHPAAVHSTGKRSKVDAVTTMFERYSEESRQAVVVARATALSMSANAIDVQHLVAGALATWPPARSSREAVAQSLDVVVPQEWNIAGDLRYSAAAQRVLHGSMSHADGLGHHRIRPEHLLLALAEEPGLNEVLHSAGIRRDVLIESAVTAALVDDGPILEPTPLKWRSE